MDQTNLEAKFLDTKNLLTHIKIRPPKIFLAKKLGFRKFLAPPPNVLDPKKSWAQKSVEQILDPRKLSDSKLLNPKKFLNLNKY